MGLLSVLFGAPAAVDEFDGGPACPAPECECDTCGRMWLAAIHECGHVVTRLALGLAFDRVWVDEQGNGCVESVDYDETDPAVVDDHIVSTLAGGEAERILIGYVSDGVDGHGGDYQSAADLLPYSSLTFEEAECAAAALVAEQWPTLDAIAAALFDAGELSGAECEAIANGWGS